MNTKLTIPEQYGDDKSLYFRQLAKHHHVPLEVVWSLYNLPITQQEWLELLVECGEKEYYQ